MVPIGRVQQDNKEPHHETGLTTAGQNNMNSCLKAGMEGTTDDDDDDDRTCVAFAGAINGTVTLEGICPAAEKLNHTENKPGGGLSQYREGFLRRDFLLSLDLERDLERPLDLDLVLQHKNMKITMTYQILNCRENQMTDEGNNISKRLPYTTLEYIFLTL
ncbi:hypothetical protein E2C01_010117 [Portunus trituberculatus]|uniref:Uncharacterized protein n=1 Tax=Portunus trituberculatus TaxID=210409 RepID=A0A5B7D7L4_PORTR|nr:hypothetical protein [Portunus trituberculatus]